PAQAPQEKALARLGKTGRVIATAGRRAKEPQPPPFAPRAAPPRPGDFFVFSNPRDGPAAVATKRSDSKPTAGTPALAARRRQARGMVASGVMRVLAGDIGGTKTAIATVDIDRNTCRVLRLVRYPSADYPGLEEIVEEFLSDEAKRPRAA